MKKSDNTKARILGASKKLFAKNGFTAVTMKDICEASDISRGGLYAYFSSTGEILSEIIENEQAHARKALNDAIESGISPELILKRFLSARTRELSDPERSISGAVSQFARSGEAGHAIAKKRAESAVKVLTTLITLGMEQKIFGNVDAELYAHEILWMIEGMAAHAELFGMDADKAEKYLGAITDMLKAAR